MNDVKVLESVIEVLNDLYAALNSPQDATGNVESKCVASPVSKSRRMTLDDDDEVTDSDCDEEDNVKPVKPLDKLYKDIGDLSYDLKLARQRVVAIRKQIRELRKQSKKLKLQ